MPARRYALPALRGGIEVAPLPLSPAFVTQFLTSNVRLFHSLCDPNEIQVDFLPIVLDLPADHAPRHPLFLEHTRQGVRDFPPWRGHASFLPDPLKDFAKRLVADVEPIVGEALPDLLPRLS